MLLSILWAMVTLRSGLALRSARQRKVQRPRDARERHLRLAKPALAMIAVGFGAGLASAFWLRGWETLGTAHGFVATASLLLFLATGWLGRQLELGRSRRVDPHALLALAAVGTSVAAFFTGFVLLP
jgi:hypothetical protein